MISAWKLRDCRETNYLIPGAEAPACQGASEQRSELPEWMRHEQRSEQRRQAGWIGGENREFVSRQSLSKPCWRMAVFGALFLSGCQQSCGDDGARLDPSPAGAIALPTAIGGAFSLTIVDGCVQGGLSPCTTETVTSITEVEQSEEVYATSTGEGGRVDLMAIAAGTTTLSLTAEFDGEGDAAGPRTAARELEAREEDALRFSPACDNTDAVTPWLIPLDGSIAVELALLGGQSDLFHHEVDWSQELTLDADGLDDASGVSPESVQLSFFSLGLQEVVRASDGEIVAPIKTYRRGDISGFFAEALVETLTAGQSVTFSPQVLVDDREVCLGDESEVIVSNIDDGPCSFSNFDDNDFQRRGDLGNSFQVFGTAAGTCTVTTWIDGTDFEDTFSLDVSAAPTNR